MPDDIKDPFYVSTTEELASRVLKVWQETKERLKRDFDVDANVDPKVIQRLEKISKLYQSRPVQVTNELITWANRED